MLAEADSAGAGRLSFSAGVVKAGPGTGRAAGVLGCALAAAAAATGVAEPAGTGVAGTDLAGGAGESEVAR